jgi:Fe-only nitrogenase accessory protein AnfO
MHSLYIQENMKIATLVDKQGNTLPFGTSGIVKLYESDGNKWQCLREILFTLDENLDLSNIRQCIYGLVSYLGSCRSFVMKKTPGIFNVILEEELGVKVWTVNGSPVEALQQIKEQSEMTRSEPSSRCGACRSSNIIAPVPVGGVESGMFRIDLVEVQQKNCSLNSREVLLPFLESKKEFIELEIICTHVPKWLYNVLDTLNMEMVTKEWKDGLCHAFIYCKL